MSDGKCRSELRSVNPSTVFALFFSSFFILVLLYYLSVNLRLVPRFSLLLLQPLRERIEALGPVARSLAYALLAGFAAGIGGAFLALMYNVFAGICGGVKGEVRE